MAKENERKKAYLNGYRACKRRIRRLEEQIAQLRSQRMFPGMENDGMPRGNTHGDLSGYMAQLDELTGSLEQERAAAIRQYREIYAQIQSMRHDTEREVLILRYLLLKTWEEIAEEVGYTYRWTLKIHGTALKNFEIPERRH